MNREPTSLYFLRLFISILLFVLLGMLYWSSLLIEEHLLDLKREIHLLQKEIEEIPQQPTSFSHPVLQRLHMDENLPNLLEADPFYQQTLPLLIGEHFSPLGTFQGAAIGKPNNLHPFNNFSQIAAWYGDCVVSIAKLAVGRYETFCPDMAIKIEARKRQDIDSDEAPEFWIHLRDDIYWEPLKEQFFPKLRLDPMFFKRHQVTAHDFVFGFNAMMNPHVEEAGAVASRTYYGDVESIEAIDSLTLVVRWKPYFIKNPEGKTNYRIRYAAKFLTGGLRPLPSFVFQYYANGEKILEEDSPSNVYRRSAIWAQNFSEHWARNVIVSCGPWLFDGMSDREIKFKRNLRFPIALQALAEGSAVQFKETPDAMWQSFKGEKIDRYNLQPDQLAELESFLQSGQYAQQKARGNGIERLDFLSRSYNYIGWNQATPYFSSRKVRLAMTMAIHRKRIIEKNLNGLGVEISCPFYLHSPSCDSKIKPWPYDLLQARRLLEEEGWFDSDGDGIIDKEIDGKRVPFQFTLTYYVKNVLGKSICEYIATNLKELGIDCRLNGVDIADLSSIFDDKSFDAIYLGWALGTPPEDPKQLWHSSGVHEKGSSNAVGFSNAEADKIIDALQYESDEEERLKLYHRFHAIIHEEVPYTFLFSPKVVMVYRSYLQNVFIPKDRQDLIPGANIAEPDGNIIWILKQGASKEV